VADDMDLPGMWSHSDFEGGETDPGPDYSRFQIHEGEVEIDHGSCGECGEQLEDPDHCEHCGWDSGDEEDAS
jgi:hypothetical protein